MWTDVDPSESRMSKVEILRGLITEKMTVAVQEILAVVETTVAGYESEVLLLKRELGHHKGQLHAILQPEVSLYRIDIDGAGTSNIFYSQSTDQCELKHEHKDADNSDYDVSEKCTRENGVDTVASKVSQVETLLEHVKSDSSLVESEESDSSVSCPAHGEENLRDYSINYVQNTMVKRKRRLPEHIRLNYNVTDSDSDICDIKKNEDNEWKPNKNKKNPNMKKQHVTKLWIGLLKNCPESDLANNGISHEGQVQTVMCQQSLSRLDFLNLLRSTFPELGQNKPFVAYLADSTKRLVPNLANRLTHNELYEAYKCHQQQKLQIYIQLKEQQDTRDILSNAGNTTHDDKPTTSDPEEKILTKTGSTCKITDEQDNMSSFGENNDLKSDLNNEDEEHTFTLKSRKKIRKQREIKFHSGSCKVCGSLFRSQTLLIKHSLSHLNNPECKCGVCGQRPESSEQLKKHLETHQKLHQCDTCDRYFLTFVAFQRHVAIHKIEKRCKQPNRHSRKHTDFDDARTPDIMSSYSSPEPGLRNVHKDTKYIDYRVSKKLDTQLKEHQDTCDTLTNTSVLHNDPTTNGLEEKTSEKSLMGSTAESTVPEDDIDRKPERRTEKKGKCDSCKVCGYLFKSKKVLAKHALNHLDDPGCMCGVCGQQLESSEELKNHVGAHQKLHQCDTCGRNFLTFVIFQKHIDTCQFRKTANANSTLWIKNALKHRDRFYKCDICPQSFRFKAQLHVHSSEHTGIKPYCCDVCGKSHSNYRSYSIHKLTHTGERNHCCKTCGKLFYSRKTLQQHEKIHTVRDKNYLCDICSKTFYCKYLLRYHQKTHDESFNITCPICAKSLKGELKEHMRTHTGEKPFTCKECGVKFRLRSHLRSHLKIHLGIKPFTCTVCGYKCARKDQLTMHMRTHTGHKPYTCGLCDKAFTQSHCLKTHMKSHQ